MKIIGLTGGIASGKSTVSSMLKYLGALVIDADLIARRIVEPGGKALYDIIKEFGTSVLKSDGTLNRKALGKIVFSYPEKLKVLNDITHPRIRDMIGDRINQIRLDNEDGVVIIDAAVLIESGMNEFVEEVWLVYVDYKTQVERLIRRDNISFQEADARIKSQLPVEDKMMLSNKIIDNTKDVEYTREQVNNLWNNLKSN